MTELDDFLTPTLARQFEAEQALINGDPEPRLAMTSQQAPVTVFGAKVPLRRGWDEDSEVLRWLASRWSNSTDYRFDLVAAGVSGDLAYLVGFEHIANSVLGVPVEPYTLRVTHVLRREDGEWRIAHRHADYLPADQTVPAS
jgi:ketosteroid isomerase-like protein